MSYGRQPSYIYECACGGEPDEAGDRHCAERHVCFAAGGTYVRWDELAQFVAKADSRGELGELVRHGYNLVNAAEGVNVTLMPPFDVDPHLCTTDQLLLWAANELDLKRPALTEALRERGLHLRTFPAGSAAIRPLVSSMNPLTAFSISPPGSSEA